MIPTEPCAGTPRRAASFLADKSSVRKSRGPSRRQADRQSISLASSFPQTRRAVDSRSESQTATTSVLKSAGLTKDIASCQTRCGMRSGANWARRPARPISPRWISGPASQTAANLLPAMQAPSDILANGTRLRFCTGHGRLANAGNRISTGEISTKKGSEHGIKIEVFHPLAQGFPKHLASLGLSKMHHFVQLFAQRGYHGKTLPQLADFHKSLQPMIFRTQEKNSAGFFAEITVPVVARARPLSPAAAATRVQPRSAAESWWPGGSAGTAAFSSCANGLAVEVLDVGDLFPGGEFTVHKIRPRHRDA